MQWILLKSKGQSKLTNRGVCWSDSVRLGFEFNDAHASAAALGNLVVDIFYLRVGGEKIRQAAAQRAGAVAVNDTHARHGGERCVVEKFIDALGSFFHRAADDVDLFRGEGRG